MEADELIIPSAEEIMFASLPVDLLVGWFVGLSAGLHKKTSEQITMTFGGRMEHEPRKNPLKTKGRIQEFCIISKKRKSLISMPEFLF